MLNHLQRGGCDVDDRPPRHLARQLIDFARHRIDSDGTGALKARDLAQAAGCSVGSIYNVFGDMHDLVMAVNGQTFLSLGSHVTDAVNSASAPDPTEQMIVMAEAYLDFASAHPQLWRALFDVPIANNHNLPDWYLSVLDALLAIIDAPLCDLFPALSDDEIRVRTKALFSAVHGIVLLGIETRLSAVENDRLSDMIRFVLGSVANRTT